MRTIAEQLRVSVMTVSRALRNAPGVHPDTHQRVLLAAAQLNYRPDPGLASLNAYRHGRRPREVRETLAFLTNFPTPTQWRRCVTFARYFDGASRRATQLGYRLEPFWLGAPGLTARRSSQILRERGIRGVLVGPLVEGETELRLEWDWFSAVAVGRSLTRPGLTTVSIHHLQVLELAWREAQRRGFRRVGFALREHEDARTTGALRAACLRQQSLGFDADHVPMLLVRDFSAREITRWVQEHRPDVLLSSEQRHYDLLDDRLRRKLPFIHLNVDPALNVAGVDQGHDVVGEHAVALLHMKILQRQTGVPTPRDLLLVEGRWQEGRLLGAAREQGSPPIAF
jgi:LacI family transcriptional regulator